MEKSSNLLTEFYQMLAPEDFSAVGEIKEESTEVSVVELDETLDVESPHLPELAATEAAATGIKILNTFTLEEEAMPFVNDSAHSQSERFQEEVLIPCDQG